MTLKSPKIQMQGQPQATKPKQPQFQQPPVVPPAPGGNLFQPLASPNPSQFAMAAKGPSQYGGGPGAPQGGNDIVEMIKKLIGGSFGG